MKIRISILALAGALLFVAAIAAADDSHPHGPPPEAFTACASSKDGDACTVQFRDKTLDGKCIASKDDSSKLFCLPNDMPAPPPSGAPLPSPPS